MSEQENKVDWEALGLMSDEEFKKIGERMDATEQKGLADIYKYFDRINDKLSSFNNMLVAGYFALVVLIPDLSKLILVIPLINLAFLILVDYRMMEEGRFLSRIKEKTTKEIDAHSKIQTKTTLLSLLTIVTTSLVTAALLVIVFNNLNKSEILL